MTMRSKLLTVREVAEWLSVSEAWVCNHASGRRRPAMPCIRIDGVIRFDPVAVNEWLGEMAKLAATYKGRVA